MSDTVPPTRPDAPASLTGPLFALSAVVVAAVSLLAGGVPAPVLDVPLDLLMAHLLCSLPLAVAATIQMQRSSRGVAMASGVTIGLLPVLLARLPVAGPDGVSLADVAVRSLLMLAAALLPVAVVMRRRAAGRLAPLPVAALLLGLVVMFLPATLYTVTVAQRLEEKLDDLLGHNRVARASEVAGQLLRVAPEATWQERPVRKLSDELAEQTQRMVEALAQVGPPRSLSEVGQRVSVCMQLDRWDEARDLLHPLATAGQPLPLALDTLGLVAQREQNWDESLRWYSKALNAWSVQSEPGNVAGRASALKGMALAQYQLGRVREAAATYEALLELQPTAGNHLLAARFYKENEQLTRARQHAEAAIALDPAIGGPVAEKLLTSLQQSRFGCFAGN
ncbi:tetratricopeptide repeat protein [Maioricimonas sp. JC845]|uniref:tetratricopeptide repeat protein n=1 Tax=Maioricimonas sp. JC845 TaxID=3232138 RepID=UPI0034587E6F